MHTPVASKLVASFERVGAKTNLAFLPVMVSILALPVALTPASYGAWRADADVSRDSGEPAAKSATEKGSLLRKAVSGKDWQVVEADKDLQSGDLVVGLPGAKLISLDKAVALHFEGNLEGKAPYPVIESAVQLKTPAGADLSLALDRGWVEVVNQKKSGKAMVRLQVLNQSWSITLQTPNTRMAMLLYGRWPRGTAFAKAPGPKAAPTLSLLLAVLHGEVSLECQGVEHSLTAPPGPAMIDWDNVAGQDASPIHLDSLPPWAAESGTESPEGRAKKAVLAKLTAALASKPVDEVLEEYLGSDDPRERRVAVYLLGALNNLPRLSQAMRETKHPDVRDEGVLALRHWIGRAPGQDQILYRRLVEERKLSPAQAETILQLLHSFGEADLARPETYQTLIDYLDHDLLPIRGLAYWHLSRLVPQGRELGYDPDASKEGRAAAIEKWRKLIPEGKLPPRAKGKENGN